MHFFIDIAIFDGYVNILTINQLVVTTIDYFPKSKPSPTPKNILRPTLLLPNQVQTEIWMWVQRRYFVHKHVKSSTLKQKIDVLKNVVQSHLSITTSLQIHLPPPVVIIVQTIVLKVTSWVKPISDIVCLLRFQHQTTGSCLFTPLFTAIDQGHREPLSSIICMYKKITQ